MFRVTSFGGFGIGLLVVASTAVAQSPKDVARSDRDPRFPSISEAPSSAVQSLNEYGFGIDGKITVDDLAKLPDSFWPAPLRYDHETNELVFKGMRSVAEESPAAKSPGRDRNAGSREETPRIVTYREERLEGRMEFTDSRIDDHGTITLIGPDGSLEIALGADGRYVLHVDPPVDNVVAFHPMKFIIEAWRVTGVNPNGSGTVATYCTSASCAICACDTANCGGGCDRDKCEDQVTCAGRCGSCAFLCSPQWCD